VSGQSSGGHPGIRGDAARSRGGEEAAIQDTRRGYHHCPGRDRRHHRSNPVLLENAMWRLACRLPSVMRRARIR
jgi:hypothetical protein